MPEPGEMAELEAVFRLAFALGAAAEAELRGSLHALCGESEASDAWQQAVNTAIPSAAPSS
jgi:hypothetical protein